LSKHLQLAQSITDHSNNKMVTYTFRYSSVHLIPNLVCNYVTELGIKYPLEYPQIQEATTYCKIKNFISIGF